MKRESLIDYNYFVHKTQRIKYKMAKITVKDTSVTIISVNENDYISLTDIARYKSDDPTAVIGNWLRNRNTIEYLGIWESLYNPSFKPLEFEGFKRKPG